MSNNSKAVIYTILGSVICLASLIGMGTMYFSSTFLPVWVGNTYVLGNQIVRYELYLILLVFIILSVKLTDYGMKYLIKKFHKKLRRR